MTTAILKPHRPKDAATRHNQRAIGITWKRRVRCSLCGELATRENAHRHQEAYIGDECCWDERLHITE
jgi:formylmethanofuran dehydrogenase subunit E